MPLYVALPNADQAIVQARRTSTFTLGGTYADIELDTTDLENATDVIEHDSGNLDRILINVTGNYEISYSATCPAGASLTTAFRVRKNDTTALNGSHFETSSDGNDKPFVSVKFLAELTDGDYISLQATADAGTPDLASGVTFLIVSLAGLKGEKGDASATDIDAIHKSTGGEIISISEKTTPVGNDALLIEDSEAANIKKYLKVGNLPGGVSLSDTAPVNVTVAAAAAGTDGSASRQDHKHNVTTAVPAVGAVVPNNSAAEGSATSLARSDHRHAVGVAAPVSVGAANAAGAATTFVRSDHVHAGLTRGAGDFDSFTAKTIPDASDLFLIEDSAAANAKKKLPLSNLLTSTAPENVTRSTASEGVSAQVARSDHKHDISTATPLTSAVSIGNSAYEGIATSLARSDHTHAVSTGDPVSVGTTNSEGVSSTFARSDHIHAGLTRGAGDFDTFTVKNPIVGNDLFLIEDSAAANAKKKVTASTIISYVSGVFSATEASAAGTITTASTTDVLATGMTITPIAGSYLVWFTSSVSNSNGNASVYASIYVGGVQNAASERVYTRGVQTHTGGFASAAIVYVNGGQAIEGRWRVSAGTGSMYQRTLHILRVG